MGSEEPQMVIKSPMKQNCPVGRSFDYLGELDLDLFLLLLLRLQVLACSLRKISVRAHACLIQIPVSCFPIHAFLIHVQPSGYDA